MRAITATGSMSVAILIGLLAARAVAESDGLRVVESLGRGAVYASDYGAAPEQLAPTALPESPNPTKRLQEVVASGAELDYAHQLLTQGAAGGVTEAPPKQLAAEELADVARMDAAPAAEPTRATAQEQEGPKVVSIGWAAESHNACGGCGDCRLCCPPPCPPRSFVFGEFLYLAPTDADVTHAQQQDGIGGTGTVPRGRIGSVGPSYNAAFRVGAGCQLGCDASLGVSFQFYESDSTDSVALPTFSGGAVGSFVHLPLATVTGSIGPVSATHDINFQTADMLFRDVCRRGDNYELRYAAGAQFGHLDQEFSQSGTFSGSAGGPIAVLSDVEFDGGGLKFGVEGERHLTHGVFVYGRATAAAMFGRVTAAYSMTNTAGPVTYGSAAWKDDRVVTQFEYELGVAMMTSNERVRLSAGFTASHWENVVTTTDWIGGVQGGAYDNLGDRLSFNGLVTRAEYRW